MSNKTVLNPNRASDGVTKAHGGMIENPAFVPFPKSALKQSIPHRFEQQVSHFPNRPAIITKEGEYSYTWLNKNANRIASEILEIASPQDNTIGVLIKDAAMTMASILGVLKAGKAFVPLDPGFPPDRLKLFVEHSEASKIITDGACVELAVRLVSNDNIIDINKIGADLSDSNPVNELAPTANAFILYTSGSTGQPKGVLHNHRSALHKFLTYTNDYQISHLDRIILLGSSSSAATLRDVFGALLSGACLFPYDVQNEGLPALSRWLLKNKISVYFSVPTLFRRFAETLSSDDRFHDVRLIMLGAEAVLSGDFELYKKHFSKDCIFVNRLGSSETGAMARYYMNMSTHLDQAVVPIGIPNDDIELSLVNDAGEETGVNEPGEIVITGRYLATGYWRDSELTAKAFQLNPLDPELRTYRTGDVASRLESGDLLYLGRKDFQVKVKGNRVNLTEIEALLSAHPDVKEAVVVARGEQQDQLVAYFVPANSKGEITKSLRQKLRESLPSYMLPWAFVEMERLPVTPVGKIDRLGLPSPELSTHLNKGTFIAPQSRLEIELADIWERALKVPGIGVENNFFDNGGDSLAAIAMLAELESIIGIHLPVSTLIEAPTIRELCNLLDSNPPAKQPRRSLLVPIQPKGTKTPFFCVPPKAKYALILSRISRHLGNEQPFYALEHRGMDDGRSPHRRVEKMAAEFVREIRTVQPSGPYLIGGMCFGGVVAFEIAKQFQAENEKIAVLAVFDTMQPPWRKTTPLKDMLRPKYWSLVRIVRGIRTNAISKQELDAIDKKRSRSVRRVDSAQQKAFHRYHPNPYDGEISLFWSDGTHDPFDRRDAWAELTTQPLKTISIPGSHSNRGDAFIKEPQVSILANELGSAITSSSAV